MKCTFNYVSSNVVATTSAVSVFAFTETEGSSCRVNMLNRTKTFHLFQSHF